MNKKEDVFAALTAYLDVNGGPDAINDFFDDYKMSIGVTGRSIAATLIVLSDGETWERVGGSHFVDVTQEELEEIEEGAKVRNVVNRRHWRPLHDTQVVWAVTPSGGDGPPYYALRTKAAAKNFLSEDPARADDSIWQLHLPPG